MRFVSLFAGAGGLDLGLELAGWSCAYASDIDRRAVASLTRNQNLKTQGLRAFSSAVIAQSDVRRLSGKEILSAIGRPRGDIQLLAGGPPCQSWSSAGHQLGFSDPRGRLFEDYIRIAKALDSRWLLFENVRGLVTARGPDGVPGSALGLIRDELRKAGWRTTVSLLNAADFGVAQRRVRLIVLGYRSGDAPQFPQPSHARDDVASPAWVTLGQCLSNIRPIEPEEIIRPSPKLKDQLDSVPPGKGVRSPGKAETTRPGGHWGYKQGAFVADLDQPARTVTANAQQDWIKDPVLGLRRLSPRECAALQSFPACWRFEGSRVDQYRLIGNAVPPGLAKAIGAVLLAHTKTAAQQGAPNATQALPRDLQAAIDYTIREEFRNGASRRAVSKRKPALRVA